MQLTAEQAAYFQQMETLFEMPGWKLLVDDFEGYKTALKDGIFGYDRSDTFFIAKGRAQAYDQLINHQGFLESLKQSILEQDDPSF